MENKSHDHIIHGVATELADMLDHKGPEKEKTIGKAKQILANHAEKHGSLSVRDAVDAIRYGGEFSQDIEEHPKHGIYASFDIPGDATEDPNYERNIEVMEEDFFNDLHGRVHQKMGAARNPVQEMYVKYLNRFNEK